MRLELVFEQALELVRIQVAAHHEAQAVGDEHHHVVIVEHHRILLEEFAVLGLLEIRLDGQQAFLAHLHEDVVDQLEQRDVLLAFVTRTLVDGERLLESQLGNLRRIAGHEGAESRAHDDEDLCGMPQRKQVPAFEHEAADDATQHDD